MPNFSTSKFGRSQLVSSGFSKPVKICTFGTSHCTTNQGIGWALQYSLARSPRDIVFYHRQVLTSNVSSVVLPDPGQSYATGQAGSAHMVGPQLTQFLADVAAGKKADWAFTDGGLYNDAPTTQAHLDTAFARTLTLIDAFLDPAVNDGLGVVVWGTFGITPWICQSWASMWRAQEAISNGRIRFLDTASVLADRTNTSGTTWLWRGGTPGTFGCASQDGAHVSSRGAEFIEPILTPLLAQICPKPYIWRGGFCMGTPDPANRPWANLLGNFAAMGGTNGQLSGVANAGVPGTGSGGGSTDRLNVTPTGSIVVTPTITAGPNGERQLEMALSGTSGAGDIIQCAYQSVMANVNQSVATRKYNHGVEIELAGVTGLNVPWLRSMGVSTWDTVVALTGNNVNWLTIFQFRSGPVSGTIKLRNPFTVLVEGF